MNINQALKEKNRLTGKLRKIDRRISENSRWIKGNTPSYDIMELLTERANLVEELIALKVAINKATVPIMETILQIAERKGFVNSMKELQVTAGIVPHRYDASTVEYEVGITERDRDDFIEKQELLISKFQDELDKFNATTEISL